MCPRPDPAAPLRLWCIPFAGGGAAVWHPWAAELAGVCEVVGVRLPGRETRLAEAPCVDARVLVAQLLEALAPHTDGAYALCGHSLGGLLAFELARAVRDAGLRGPRALVVAGIRAPHHRPDEPLVHRLVDAALVAEVERRYGGIPREIRDDPELLGLVLPILRADLQAYETYRHTPAAVLDLPLLALGGTEDTNVSRAQLEDWAGYTRGPFESVMLPGGHFFLQENRRAAAPIVRRFLEHHAGAARA